MKQSFILFETILSIALFFIVVSITTNFSIKLQEKSKRLHYQSIVLLKLEATKQFLANNQNLTALIYNDQKLFYNGNLLLDEVSNCTIDIGANIAVVDICIDHNKVCQKWKIKV